MQQEHNEPQSPTGLPAPRHDGWSGERMAAFLEVLADTGIVSEACRAAGMHRSGAYALRHRNRIFDAAWSAAETLARSQVADGLLERSITGTVEHYYRDGVLVGERRHYESWLGLAALKRLDKQAADARAAESLSARIADGWQETLEALRSSGTEAVPKLLEPEVDKIDRPPPPGCDPSDNVWQNDDGAWMTTFPPPPGFDGHESGSPDGPDHYERACTAEEIAILEADAARACAAERAASEALRDEWFALLKQASTE
jgi:hypothetical protein